MEEDQLDLLDINILEQKNPIAILHYVCQQRLRSIMSLRDALPFDTAKLYMQDTMRELVNPLLLASAISMSIVKRCDFQFLLKEYLMGLNPGFEEHLLRVPVLESEDQLTTFLEFETKFVQGLYLLSLLFMLPSISTEFVKKFPEAGTENQTRQWLKLLVLGDLLSQERRNALENPEAPRFLLEYWEQLRAYDPLDEETQPSIEGQWLDKFGAFYYAWKIFNPTLLLLEPTAPSKLLDWYGSSRDSVIHNTREFYRYELEETKKSLNMALKSSLPKEKKRDILVEANQRMVNAGRLVRRSHRFYEWLPHEIVAHRSSVMNSMRSLAIHAKHDDQLTQQNKEAVIGMFRRRLDGMRHYGE